MVFARSIYYVCISIFQAALGGKKKKKTPQIKQVRENDMDEGEFDEFDDFM